MGMIQKLYNANNLHIKVFIAFLIMGTLVLATETFQTSGMELNTAVKPKETIVYNTRSYNTSESTWNYWTAEKFQITGVSFSNDSITILADHWVSDSLEFSENPTEHNITLAKIDGSFYRGAYIISNTSKITEYLDQIEQYYEKIYNQSQYTITITEVSDGYGYHSEITNDSGTVLKEEFIYSTTGILLYGFSGKNLFDKTLMEKTEIQIVPKYSTVPGANEDFIKPEGMIDGFNQYFLILASLSIIYILIKGTKERLNWRR